MKLIPDHIGVPSPNWIRDRFLLESNENLYDIPNTYFKISTNCFRIFAYIYSII